MTENAQNFPKEVLDFAKKLARAHRQTEEEISEIYLAPFKDRVLLVEVDPSGFPNDEGKPFPLYFKAAPRDGVPFPSAVIFLTPKQKKAKVPLPKDWGSWDQLTPIYIKRKLKKRGKKNEA